MRTLFLSSFLLFSLTAFAQVEDCDNEAATKLMKAVEKAATEEICPNPKKIRLLCMYIHDRSEEPEESKYRYTYQKVIHEAACVKSDDKKTVRFKKIQDMWKKLEDQLICNNTQFSVPNGNVIKYAATTMFDEFINDVIYWGVDLNKVDKTDGRTVLDYLKDSIERAKKGQPATAKTLQEYYDMLREAGAKHKSEL